MCTHNWFYVPFYRQFDYAWWFIYKMIGIPTRIIISYAVEILLISAFRKMDRSIISHTFIIIMIDMFCILIN